MIVICPACQIRYLVSEDALGAEGEGSLRCPSCLHLWQYSPEGAAIQATLAEVATAAREDDPPSTRGPAPPPGGSRLNLAQGLPRARAAVAATPPGDALALLERDTARRRSVQATVVGGTMLALGLLIGGYIARDAIVATWPSAAPALATLHLTQSPGRGLKISSVLTRTDDSFVVAGDIVNQAEEPRRLPRLRLTLRDGSQGELDFKIIEPPVEELMPGAVAHFTGVFEHPSITATGIAVEFAVN